MTRIRNKLQFSDALDMEFSWRLKEIDDLRQLIKTSQSIRQRTLLRAGLAMLYAHWEGFIKAASELYLNYLAHKKIPYQELRLCLVALGLKGYVNTIEVSGKAESNMAAVKFITENLSKPAKLPFKDSIETGSNLSSANFKMIADWIGVDAEPYLIHSQFIDSSLVGRRNQVAHGESIDLEFDDYKNLSEEVIKLLRYFKVDLENSVVNEKYLMVNA